MRRIVIVHFLLLWSSTLLWADGNDKPQIVNVGFVAENIVAITIDDGNIIHAKQEKYIKQTGDEINQWNGLKRNGVAVGSVGGQNLEYYLPYDKVTGQRFNVLNSGKVDRYKLSSVGDPNYSQALVPSKVNIKSKLQQIAVVGDWKFDGKKRTIVYLTIPRPMKLDQEYILSFSDSTLQDLKFIYNPKKSRSESIHVNHLGFSQNDPEKLAFLSLWLGDGGAYTGFKEGHTFSILDAKTLQSKFSGKIKAGKRANELGEGGSWTADLNRNYTMTDVFYIDFSEFSVPGNYVIYLENIGISNPFEINNKTWEKAFLVSSKGLFNQRSGIELGPPYSEFKRPVNMHNKLSGQKIYVTKESLMETREGLNIFEEKTEFDWIAKAKTDSILESEIYGGYMDAGDWDRRIQHLVVSRNLIELCDMYPIYFSKLNLNIPESKNDLPDIIDEAIWNVSVYFRLQMADGAIRGGVQSMSDPQSAVCSWQSGDLVTYKPDIWSTYQYTSTAAKLAYWLEKNGYNQLASMYTESSLKAMVWAENEWKTLQSGKNDAKYNRTEISDHRNLAAVELWRLTGEKKYHAIFLETTSYKDERSRTYGWQEYNQVEAPFTYLRTARAGKNNDILENCVSVYIKEAEQVLELSSTTGYKWSKFPFTSWGGGQTTAPESADILAKAFFISGDQKYLKTLVTQYQFTLGANPSNLNYTTGLGYEWANGYCHDAHVTGQNKPTGRTVYGPVDANGQWKEWWSYNGWNHLMYPKIQDWPPLECYVEADNYMIFMTEYTVDFFARNTFIWGWLAAINSEAKKE